MDKKQILVGLVGIAAITLVALFVWKAGKPTESLFGGPQAGTSPTPTATTTPRVTVKGTPTITMNLQDYTKYVQEYAGRRIQFNDQCQVNPVSSTYTNGTKLMFDNRSAQARTVTIGGTKYAFTAWGYRFITLSSKKLPATLSINCGSSVGSGTILLQ